MRILIARCAVNYSGRLDAHLPLAPRVIMVKGDGSVLVHSDGGSYKPLNWMSPPCVLTEAEAAAEERDQGVEQVWTVRATKSQDQLTILIHEVIADTSYELGADPGLVKDGVEAHLQELLAAKLTDVLGPGWRCVRREWPTAIGPVDLLVTDPEDNHVAIEVKRRGEIDGVEQLTRYLELLGRDGTLRNIRGIFAAQVIKPQARVLAEDRGITCVTLDYDMLRGLDDPDSRLF